MVSLSHKAEANVLWNILNESLWTSQEGTKGQDVTARSMAGCEDMIERLTEPVAAHILEAAAQDQVVLGHLPAAERSEEQLATFGGQHRDSLKVRLVKNRRAGPL